MYTKRIVQKLRIFGISSLLPLFVASSYYLWMIFQGRLHHVQQPSGLSLASDVSLSYYYYAFWYISEWSHSHHLFRDSSSLTLRSVSVLQTRRLFSIMLHIYYHLHDYAHRMLRVKTTYFTTSSTTNNNRCSDCILTHSLFHLGAHTWHGTHVPQCNGIVTFFSITRYWL